MCFEHGIDIMHGVCIHLMYAEKSARENPIIISACEGCYYLLQMPTVMLLALQHG